MSLEKLLVEKRGINYNEKIRHQVCKAKGDNCTQLRDVITIRLKIKKISWHIGNRYFQNRWFFSKSLSRNLYVEQVLYTVERPTCLVLCQANEKLHKYSISFSAEPCQTRGD